MSTDGPAPEPQFSVSHEVFEELFRRLSLRPEFETQLVQHLRQLGAEGRLRNHTRLANCLKVDPADVP